jgi:four helix bundle protein
MPGLYKKLIVWQKSMLLVEEVHRLTKRFPVYEKTNLIDQMHRSSMSIPANIAEGQYRFSKNQNSQYLRIAYGSCAELDTQIAIAEKLSYVVSADTQRCIELLDEVMRMLNSMLKKQRGWN